MVPYLSEVPGVLVGKYLIVATGREGSMDAKSQLPRCCDCPAFFSAQGMCCVVRTCRVTSIHPSNGTPHSSTAVSFTCHIHLHLFSPPLLPPSPAPSLSLIPHLTSTILRCFPSVIHPPSSSPNPLIATPSRLISSSLNPKPRRLVPLASCLQIDGSCFPPPFSTATNLFRALCLSGCSLLVAALFLTPPTEGKNSLAPGPQRTFHDSPTPLHHFTSTTTFPPPPFTNFLTQLRASRSQSG